MTKSANALTPGTGPCERLEAARVNSFEAYQDDKLKEVDKHCFDTSSPATRGPCAVSRAGWGNLHEHWVFVRAWANLSFVHFAGLAVQAGSG